MLSLISLCILVLNLLQNTSSTINRCVPNVTNWTKVETSNDCAEHLFYEIDNNILKITTDVNVPNHCSLEFHIPLSCSLMIEILPIENTNKSCVDKCSFINPGKMNELLLCGDGILSYFRQVPPCSIRFVGDRLDLRLLGTNWKQMTIKITLLCCFNSLRERQLVEITDCYSFDIGSNNCSQKLTVDNVEKCVIVGNFSDEYWQLVKTAACTFKCPMTCSCVLRSGFLERTCWNEGKSSQTQFAIFYPAEKSERLYLGYNNLTEVREEAFVTFPALTELYLQQNKIHILHPCVFCNLTYLSRLDLGWNKLSYIDASLFSGLHNLKELFIDRNNLSYFPEGIFKDLKNIEQFHADHNSLTDLTPGVFNGLHKLAALYLNHNQLYQLKKNTFRTLYNFKILHLYNNVLRVIDAGAFNDLHRLENLLLENNTLDAMEDGTFVQLSSLSTLALRGNPLMWVHLKTFTGLSNSTNVIVDKHATCCFIGTSTCLAGNPKPSLLTCERMLPNKVLRISMWLLGLAALFGNIAVLIWRCKQHDRFHVQSLLISNVAFCDLLMGIYMLVLTTADMYFQDYFPSHAYEWTRSIPCTIAGFLSILSSEASIFFVTLISVDRFLGVKHPFGTFRLTKESVKLAVTLIWISAVVISAIPTALTYLSSEFYDVSEVCIGLPLARKEIATTHKVEVSVFTFWEDTMEIEVSETTGSKPTMYYSIGVFLGLNLLCCLVVGFCYIQIFIFAKKTRRESGRRVERDEEVRMAAKMALIVMTDFCCWMPIIIMGILVQSGVLEISPVVYAWSVTFILPINSSVNPFLYTLATVVTEFWQKRKSSKSDKDKHKAMTRITDGSSDNVMAISTLISKDGN